MLKIYCDSFIAPSFTTSIDTKMPSITTLANLVNDEEMRSRANLLQPTTRRFTEIPSIEGMLSFVRNFTENSSNESWVGYRPGGSELTLDDVKELYEAVVCVSLGKLLPAAKDSVTMMAPEDSVVPVEESRRKELIDVYSRFVARPVQTYVSASLIAIPIDPLYTWGDYFQTDIDDPDDSFFKCLLQVPTKAINGKFCELVRQFSFAVLVLGRPPVPESIVIPLRSEERSYLATKGVTKGLYGRFEKIDAVASFGNAVVRSGMKLYTDNAWLLDYIGSTRGYYTEVFLATIYEAYRTKRTGMDTRSLASKNSDNTMITLVFRQLLRPMAASFETSLAEMRDVVAYYGLEDTDVPLLTSPVTRMIQARIRLFKHFFGIMQRGVRRAIAVHDSTVSHIDSKVDGGRILDPRKDVSAKKVSKVAGTLWEQVWVPIRNGLATLQPPISDLQWCDEEQAIEAWKNHLRATNRDAQNLGILILLLLHSDSLPHRPQVTLESLVCEWTLKELGGVRRYLFKMTRSFKTSTRSSADPVSRSWWVPAELTPLIEVYIRFARPAILGVNSAKKELFVNEKGGSVHDSPGWAYRIFVDIGKAHLGIPRLGINSFRTFRLASLAEQGLLTTKNAGFAAAMLQTSVRTMNHSYLTQIDKSSVQTLQDSVFASNSFGDNNEETAPIVPVPKTLLQLREESLPRVVELATKYPTTKEFFDSAVRKRKRQELDDDSKWINELGFADTGYKTFMRYMRKTKTGV